MAETSKLNIKITNDALRESIRAEARTQGWAGSGG